MDHFVASEIDHSAPEATSVSFLKKTSKRKKPHLKFPLEKLRPYQNELNNHSIYSKISLENLPRFMEYHIFAVWDFMSLAKGLQGRIAPTETPWLPQRSGGGLTRFINEIILSEESDELILRGQKFYLSHFQMYSLALSEMGGDLNPINSFLEYVKTAGIREALKSEDIPRPAKEFMQSTFQVLGTQKDHVIAASFALGREQVIPSMFRSILNHLAEARQKAPIFHAYLDRHIHLDEETHGPMAISMLETFIAGDPNFMDEAVKAGITAIKSRIKFWDQVEVALSLDS